MLRIGIDLMGSDTAPEELFPAVMELVSGLDSDVTLVPVATEMVLDSLMSFLADEGTDLSRLDPLVAGSVIEMSDAPLTAVRTKRTATMIVAVRKLAESKLNAVVSAGNTGALMASAAMYLKSLPGVDRPPLLAQLPSARGPVAVLDVGGLVNWHAEQLIQFAHLGASFQRCYQGVESPRIGLLNIGSEAMKGNTELRRAYGLMQERPLPRGEFIGNVEGVDVFKGTVDVLVTDGFTGNVFLKASEGLASFLIDALRDRVGGFKEQSAQRALEDIEAMTNHAEHPGALVCGMDGIVIKCHGASSSKGIRNGVLGAIRYLRAGLISSLRQELAIT